MADHIRYGASCFRAAGLCFGHGTDNAVDEALVLVLHAVHLDDFGPGRSPLPGELFHARVTGPERARIHALLERRIAERIPAAYLTGKAWFAGLELAVDRRVMVPRSPIAELCERRFEPWLGPERVARVLDVGTGSGCIAIACAYAFPRARVDAVDVDADALAVARSNVDAHALGARVRLVLCDGLDAVPGRYDLIVSNPPYVPRASLEALPPEYAHEPRRALAAGEDGLAVVRRLIAAAPAHLEPGGILVVEVGEARPALEAAYPDLPFVWLDAELARSGEGVFLLTAEALAPPEGLE